MHHTQKLINVTLSLKKGKILGGAMLHQAQHDNNCSVSKQRKGKTILNIFSWKLILPTLFSFSLLFGDGVSFRGKTKDQLIGQPIPLAFANMVTSNYNILPSQINPQRGTFLIIVPDGIVQYLGDFVAFKNSQGFDVDVIALSEAGESAPAIKSTIASKLAEDPMLEYVLLMGDVDGFAAFPSFYYGPDNDVSDQKYTHILGDDNIPDVFIGRLSIDSLSDLAVIIAKTIQYATDPLLYDSDWLSRGLIVAGNYSNSYPIPITPKWTSYWLRDELLDYGYSQIDTVFYPPVQQGAPYIIPAINNGVGIVNYRGWGDANGWHYPEFHVDDVNDLNNGWLTPVFMSYVCNSNDFANNVDPCLSEAVLRGGTPSVPKGGVAFIGPSDLHTSTKYNNVINAYMYDAMLNHSVVELGPAMQAGQSGLLTEFPAQNGPGEAQEFYAHVYNILGDPSLPVYLNTPKEFTFQINEINANDGYVRVKILNENGNPVRGTVVAIMNGNEFLGKSVTLEDGWVVTNVNVDGVNSLDIYANKGGFIQGHAIEPVVDTIGDHILSEIQITQTTGSGNLAFGEELYFSISVENVSGNQTGSFSGLLRIIGDPPVPSITYDLDFPAMNVGETIIISDIGPAVLYEPHYGNIVDGEVEKSNGSKIGDFAIEFELPVFDISFENTSVTPNSTIEPVLSIKSYSNVAYNDIWVNISCMNDSTDCIIGPHDDNSVPVTSIAAFEEQLFTYYADLGIGDISYGSDITLLVEFLKDDHPLFSQEVPIHIEPPSDNIPVAPNNYGYWAYDDTDAGFEQTPTFDWVELDPAHGGSNGTYYQMDDDDHEDIELPYTFKYHGIDYNQITVSSNGWTSFVPCYIDYFWNMSIPMYMGPKAMLAPFSDDLETIDTNNDGNIDVWIHVYTWHDEANGRFIIEWSRALNGYDEVTEETFEIILYDQNAMPTESGNGVIDFQYLEVEDVDVTKNYSTVGIESPTKNYGLQYVFNNLYAPGAAPLADERVIRFTTEAPDNYVAPLAVDDELNPHEFSLSPAYPNPFNPVTHLDLKIPTAERVKVTVVDILGREVAILQNGMMAPGHYKISWNGTNRFGKTVASGTYFSVMKYGEKTKVQKLLLLK